MFSQGGNRPPSLKSSPSTGKEFLGNPMSQQVMIIAGTAAALGFVHTLLGPDHYLPFAAIAKARSWSLAKTLFITFLCGLGHVLSSVILGFAGIAMGMALFRLERIESLRGDIAASFLIIFGFAYFVWGLHQALRNRKHKHAHVHGGDGSHHHEHNHHGDHTHLHEGKSESTITPWILFTIFVFGPCEPLIPLIMYPASQHDMYAVALVASVFSLVTVATMLGIVALVFLGLSRIPLSRFGRYAHAAAGFSIFLCGGAIKFLGL
ncbi:MAG: hypothetical protein RDV48_24535 [Candidatus Eremiobacteraeota bacterium]|nr:hypothetical protein [Candidatus Eremiobacteraeota bacterium]